MLWPGASDIKFLWLHRSRKGALAWWNCGVWGRNNQILACQTARWNFSLNPSKYLSDTLKPYQVFMIWHVVHFNKSEKFLWLQWTIQINWKWILWLSICRLYLRKLIKIWLQTIPNLFDIPDSPWEFFCSQLLLFHSNSRHKLGDNTIIDVFAEMTSGRFEDKVLSMLVVRRNLLAVKSQLDNFKKKSFQAKRLNVCEKCFCVVYHIAVMLLIGVFIYHRTLVVV